MKLSETKYIEASSLFKMPFNGNDVPHIVIEVNQKCNISCKACYKDKFNYTKPLDLIISEIDFALSKRNLHLITLAGGEPSLHPQLAEVIKYISGKGLLVDMLSNGFALTDRKLKEYKEARLNKIYLHIDGHQTRPDLKESSNEIELNNLRQKISKKILSNGIECALEVTLYKSKLNQFNNFISYFLTNDLNKKLLVTCCGDFKDIQCFTRNTNKITKEGIQLSSLEKEVVLNDEVIEYIHKYFGALPYAYIPSNKNNNEKRWIFYLTFAIHLKNGSTKLLHTNTYFKHIAKLGNKIFYNKTGKYPFDIIWNRKQIINKCLLYAVYSLNPIVFFKTMFFLSHLFKSEAKLSYKTMCFQQLPNLNNNEIEYCMNCPDMTVKNNKLIPVCMVDILS